MWDEMPNIGGLGTVHDLNADKPTPALWNCKSVSKAAAIAIDKKPEPLRNPIGFFTGKRR